MTELNKVNPNYLEELLILKNNNSKTVVKKSNQKFTQVGNTLISKSLIEKFEKIAKLEETQKAQKIKQFQKVKSMLESSGMTSINQVSYGTISITVTNRKNGNMQTEIFGEVI